jgi:hypothetical protein
MSPVLATGVAIQFFSEVPAGVAACHAGPLRVLEHVRNNPNHRGVTKTFIRATQKALDKFEGGSDSFFLSVLDCRIEDAPSKDLGKQTVFTETTILSDLGN